MEHTWFKVGNGENAFDAGMELLKAAMEAEEDYSTTPHIIAMIAVVSYVNWKAAQSGDSEAVSKTSAALVAFGYCLAAHPELITPVRDALVAKYGLEPAVNPDSTAATMRRIRKMMDSLPPELLKDLRQAVVLDGGELKKFSIDPAEGLIPEDD